MPTVTVDEVRPVVSLNADDGIPVEPPEDPLEVLVAGCASVDEQAVSVPARTRVTRATATVPPRRRPTVPPPRMVWLFMVSPLVKVPGGSLTRPPGVVLRCRL